MINLKYISGFARTIKDHLTMYFKYSQLSNTFLHKKIVNTKIRYTYFKETLFSNIQIDSSSCSSHSAMHKKGLLSIVANAVCGPLR